VVLAQRQYLEQLLITAVQVAEELTRLQMNIALAAVALVLVEMALTVVRLLAAVLTELAVMVELG
jgi:hypothetical protein